MTNVTKPEIWIVHSPKAGRGGRGERLAELETGLLTTGYPSRRIGLSELVDFGKTNSVQRDEDPHAIIAAGGDGTIRLVAQHTRRDIPIIPLPMGTENLLARYYGYTDSVADVLETIQRGKRFQMDAGQANGKIFLVMATAGFDAEVVRAMHLTRRGPIRKWSYAKPIIRAIRKYRFPLISAGLSSSTIDLCEPKAPGYHQVSAKWMMVFNLPCYGGGLQIEPDAVGHDGQLDLIAFRDGSLISGACHVIRTYLQRHFAHAGTTRIRIRSTRWSATSRVPFQLDGDYAGHLPVNIKILPQQVTMLAPRGFQVPLSTDN